MRFKVDENLPSEVAEDLRAAGHDALAFVRRALPKLLDLDLRGRLAVVSEAGIRIR